MSILLLTFGMAFGATETASVTLKATVAETAFNSGIRIKEGDLSEVVSSSEIFDTKFNESSDSVLIDLGEISAYSSSGYFSVLIKRPDTIAIKVEVEATPMKKIIGTPYYLGFKIIDKESMVSFIDTTLNPENGVSGLTYSATNIYDNDGSIRDTRVFGYEVPQNTSAPLGEYSTNVSFSIIIQ